MNFSSYALSNFGLIQNQNNVKQSPVCTCTLVFIFKYPINYHEIFFPSKTLTVSHTFRSNALCI